MNNEITFAELAPVLNTIILPAVRSQMYERAPLWQLLGGWSAEKAEMTRANVGVEKFENMEMKLPIRTSYHSGVVSIGVSKSYRHGQPQMNLTSQPVRTLVGSFIIPKQALRVTDAGAVVKPLAFYTKTLANDMAMDANRQAHSDGSGVIATVASSGTSQTIHLTPSTNGDIDYSRYLPPGTLIQIGSNDAVEVETNPGSNVITIASAQTIAQGDNIIKLDDDEDPAEEMDGLGALVNSGLYQGVNSSSVAMWQSYLDSASETVTPSTIRAKLNAAYFKAQANGKVNWLLMNATAFQVYGASLEDRIRATQKEVLSGGWVGLDYMGGNAKILLDFDAPDDKIKLLSTEEIVFGMLQDLEWEKGTDGTLMKVEGKLDYEVTASFMGNIATHARNAHAALTNKTFSLT